MKSCIIKYTVKGEKHEATVIPRKGWEQQYEQNIINRIESLVDGGAVITCIIQYTK